MIYDVIIVMFLLGCFSRNNSWYLFSLADLHQSRFGGELKTQYKYKYPEREKPTATVDRDMSKNNTIALFVLKEYCSLLVLYQVLVPGTVNHQ